MAEAEIEEVEEEVEEVEEEEWRTDDSIYGLVAGQFQTSFFILINNIFLFF
jgi:hypothetical protein